MKLVLMRIDVSRTNLSSIHCDGKKEKAPGIVKFQVLRELRL